jgi:hypothetical protein
MIATEPKVNPAGLYELKEAAAALGIDRSTLTRAANRTENGIRYSIRRSNHRRVFRGIDIINYWRLTTY